MNSAFNLLDASLKVVVQCVSMLDAMLEHHSGCLRCYQH